MVGLEGEWRLNLLGNCRLLLHQEEEFFEASDPVAAETMRRIGRLGSQEEQDEVCLIEAALHCRIMPERADVWRRGSSCSSLRGWRANRDCRAVFPMARATSDPLRTVCLRSACKVRQNRGRGREVVEMAKNAPTGDGHRIGAVRGRSQTQTPQRQLGQARCGDRFRLDLRLARRRAAGAAAPLAVHLRSGVAPIALDLARDRTRLAGDRRRPAEGRRAVEPAGPPPDAGPLHDLTSSGRASRTRRGPPARRCAPR